MLRNPLNTRGVTQAAMKLVDGDGFDALNLSAVAEDLGVGPSALYTHVDGLSGLRYLVAVQSTTNLATEIRNAAVGVAGNGALEAIGTAYRNFAHTNAGQFASTFLPPLSDNDDLANANRSLLDVFVLVYRAMGLTPDQSHLAARSTRSADPRLLRPRAGFGHQPRARRRIPPPPRNAPPRPTTRPTNRHDPSHLGPDAPPRHIRSHQPEGRQ